MKIGERILRYDSVTSTNDIIRDLIQNGGQEGIVVVADRQTAGRGRRGHTWSAPAESALLFSVLLRPEKLSAFQISAIASVAVAKTLQFEADVTPQIKWPNDVYLQGYKISGILAEGNLQGTRLRSCALGIGLNLNTEQKAFPKDLRKTATSLYMVTNRIYDRDTILQTLLFNLNDSYQAANSGKFDSVFQEWKNYLIWMGSEVKVTSEFESFHGVAEDVSPDGVLLIRMQDDTVRKVFAGDVSLQKDISS